MNILTEKDYSLTNKENINYFLPQTHANTEKNNVNSFKNNNITYARNNSEQEL